MAAGGSWKDDERDLAEDLRNYVFKNFQRSDILDFMRRDYPSYNLTGALQHWTGGFVSLIYFTLISDDDTSVETVKEALKKEIDGPGKRLGYRLLTQKLRNEHQIKVPRHLVQNVMCDVDPEGIKNRSVRKRLKKKKQPFVSDGPGWLFSVDGHGKLTGFRNSTFPVAIYGCMDTFSRHMNFIFVWD